MQCLSTEVSLPKAPVVDSVSKGVRILSHRGAAAAGIILLYFQGLASSIWKVKLKTLYIFRKSHAAIMCDAPFSLPVLLALPAQDCMFSVVCETSTFICLLFAECSVHVRCFLQLYFRFTVRTVTLSQLQHTVVISSLESVVL